MTSPGGLLFMAASQGEAMFGTTKLLRTIIQQQRQIMGDITELRAKLQKLADSVAKETTIVSSVKTLLNGLSSQLAAARAEIAGQGAIDTSSLDALQTLIDANNDSLTASVVSNTSMDPTAGATTQTDPTAGATTQTDPATPPAAPATDPAAPPAAQTDPAAPPAQ